MPNLRTIIAGCHPPKISHQTNASALLSSMNSWTVEPRVLSPIGRTVIGACLYSTKQHSNPSPMAALRCASVPNNSATAYL